jgi:drug/metabolite transporter (DMT)-like permease
VREPWRQHFLIAESVLVAVVVVAFVVWAERLGGWPSVDEALRGHRSDFYGAAAQLVGSLLGFAIAAFAIAIAPLGSVRLRSFRSSGQVTTLVRVFTAATAALGVSTVVCLAGLILDDDAQPKPWIFYAALLFLLLSMTTLARCVWALHSIVSIVSGDSKARTGEE